MKYFDIVNEQDEVIGSATAAECHQDPTLIHRVVHFTLVDGRNKKILITKRSPHVKFDSGLWCFPGEHVLQGEDAPGAVFKGLQNELGVSLSMGIGEYCHTIFHSDTQTEFARFFVGYYVDEVLIPNSEEISEVKWVTLDELRRDRDTFSKMTQHWVDHANWDKILALDFHTW